MQAATRNLIIEKGATTYKDITWKDSTGTAINLTGYTARMQVRPSISSSTVLIDMTTENGKIVLGGTVGTIRLIFDAAETLALTANAGVYDLFLETNDVSYKLLKGTVSFIDAVTR